MYSKKEMDQFLSNNDLVDRLEDLRTQMNEMKQDYFSKVEPKLKQAAFDATTVDEVMKLDINWSEKAVLIHFLSLQARGTEEVYLSAAADSINMKRPAYSKAARKLAEKGYLRPTVKRSVYKLNKIF